MFSDIHGLVCYKQHQTGQCACQCELWKLLTVNLCTISKLAFTFYYFFLSFETCAKIQNEESVILFVVVWTITEITRYSFYTFNLLNHLPYFIKWARYKCGMPLNLISQQQNCMAWFHLFTLHGVVSTCLIVFKMF